MTAMEPSNRLVDALAKVEWQRVEEQSSARFGLLCGLLRDAVHAVDVCDAVWKSTVGGAIVMAVIGMVAVWTRMGVGVTVALLSVHQLLRGIFLWGRHLGSRRYACLAEDELVDFVDDLVESQRMRSGS